jgi:c-di-GMP-binding flagellar brake protein YcgR
MGDENQDQNKRAFPRVPLSVDLYLRVNKPPEVRVKIKDQTKIGHSVDISETGISFLLDTEIPKSSEVEISFNLISAKGERFVIAAAGEVRYCFPRSPGKSYRIGVVFINLKDNEKLLIADYVKSITPNR